MYIPRFIEKQINKYIGKGKAIIIYGPRQVGKTTLIKKICQNINKKIQIVSGEDIRTQTWLSSRNISKLKEFIGNTEVLVIDEAQRVDQIGLNLKLIVDNIPSVQIIATGSSSFELANQVGEPLVGRKWQFILYPIAQLELSHTETRLETENNLAQRLIFGGYPEIITTKNIIKKQELLLAILDNQLFKDLLMMEEIRKSKKLIDLLKMLAFQIGQEVSQTEIANHLSINIATVDRYLDLLEKVFVIKKAGAYSRNLRKEIYKTCRYYFFDNGVRNALINNFNDLETRNDTGQLWENYLFIERLKKQQYKKIFSNNYFWRTYDKKEIDFVEEREGKLYGFEFKWGNKKTKKPKDWLITYKNASFEIINKDNYLNFIT